MGRSWQVFVAPGDESASLPIMASPWHDERWVKIPKEHWEVILEFAEGIDAEKADKLRSYSWAADYNELDYIHVSLEELEVAVQFLDELRQAIQSADPLVPEATEDVPDAYVNAEHVRMIEAVKAVFQETIRLHQPFRAWIE